MTFPECVVRCRKCYGAGWLWWFELDDYDGPALETGQDDTKYLCDACEGRDVEEEVVKRDIVESLRDWARKAISAQCAEVCEAAAAEIERLRSSVQYEVLRSQQEEVEHLRQCNQELRRQLEWWKEQRGTDS